MRQQGQGTGRGSNEGLYAVPIAAMIGLTLAGCHRHVYSPPTRLVPLETAATVDTEQTGLGVDGKAAGITFGAHVAGGTLRVRRGLAPDLEGSVEASAIVVTNDGDAPVHRGAYSLRLGTKYRVHKHIALIAGLGGGGSAAGGSISPDVGAILAYENRYFVPFVSATVSASLPFYVQTIPLPDDDDEQDQRDERASAAFYGSGQLGFRVPFEDERGNGAALLLAVSMGYVADTEEDTPYFGIGAGVDTVF